LRLLAVLLKILLLERQLAVKQVEARDLGRELEDVSRREPTLESMEGERSGAQRRVEALFNEKHDLTKATNDLVRIRSSFKITR
jgi:hypothetical protein